MERLLEYPIIAIGKGQILHFARKVDDLNTCSAKGLKSGYYNNLTVIDSNGKKYLIKRAEKIGTAGLLWGFSFLMGQRLQVRLHFDNQETEMSLVEFKQLILNSLKKDEYFWNSDGDLEGRKLSIQDAKSHFEIIARLTDEFYKKYK